MAHGGVAGAAVEGLVVVLVVIVLLAVMLRERRGGDAADRLTDDERTAS